MAISESSPEGSGTVTRWPLIAMKLTQASVPCGKRRTRPATSSRRRIGQQAGLTQSPHTFSRGNFSRSKIAVCKPAAAQNAAQLDPAGPPPTIATSNIRDYLPVATFSQAGSYFKLTDASRSEGKNKLDGERGRSGAQTRGLLDAGSSS